MHLLQEEMYVIILLVFILLEIISKMWETEVQSLLLARWFRVFLCSFFFFFLCFVEVYVNWVGRVTGVSACVWVCGWFATDWLVCVSWATLCLDGWLHHWLDVCGNGSKGCSNNNYASRDKCKKCGETKELAAMPATAMPGAAYQTPGHYFPGLSGGLGSGMNMNMSVPLHHPPLPPGSSWPFSGGDTNALPGTSGPNGVLNSKSWRAGDWICVCGYHNYSSRTMCNQCNAPMSSAAPLSTTTATVPFPGLGTKRSASDNFGNDWASKRLNLGADLTAQYLNQPLMQYGGLEERGRFLLDQSPGFNMGIASGSLSVPNFHMQSSLQQPPLTMVPTLLGKGAKQWRPGDWMCTNCNNHNFASRENCNRCNTKKEVGTQPLPVS